MDDFIFCGRALSEFRAHALFGRSTTIAGAMSRAQYDTGGEEPLDLHDARAKTFPVAVTIIPMDGERATDEWQSRILRWLRAARGPLTLTRRPDRYRLAQFDHEMRFSRASWPHGAIETTITMSGCLYASRESEISFEAGENGSGTFYFSTGEDRPARISIIPKDGSIISSAQITAGERTVSLEGLNVASELMIDQASERVSVTADGESAFGSVTIWDELRVDNGVTVSVVLAYASGAAAHVTIAARGRWTA